MADADEPTAAGAMIVRRWGPRFPPTGVNVFRLGIYTTRKAHDNPYVHYGLLHVVTVITVWRFSVAVGAPPAVKRR